MSTPPVNPPTTILENAPTVGQLTPEQRQKKLTELRKRMGQSRLAVKGLPGRHYFWAPKTDGAEMVKLDSQGYQITKEPNAVEVLAGKAKPKIEAAGLQRDGTYVIGDVILTDCDIDMYEMYMLETDDQLHQMKLSATEDFKAEAESVGAPTFETSPRKRGK